MVDPSRPRRRRNVDDAQVGLKLALIGLAGLGTGALLRVALGLAAIDDQSWLKATVDAVTIAIVWPLQQIPGAMGPRLREATLPDLTMTVLCALAFLILGLERQRG